MERETAPRSSSELVNLPTELLQDIFNYLNARDLGLLRKTCTRIQSMAQKAAHELLAAHHQRLQTVLSPADVTGLSLLQLVRQYLKLYGRPTPPMPRMLEMQCYSTAKLFFGSRNFSKSETRIKLLVAFAAFFIWIDEAEIGPMSLQQRTQSFGQSGNIAELLDEICYEAFRASFGEEHLQRIVDHLQTDGPISIEEALAACLELRYHPLEGELLDTVAMSDARESVRTSILDNLHYDEEGMMVGKRKIHEARRWGRF